VKVKAQKPTRYSHQPESGFRIRGRVWLEKDGELFIGWGRILLLENITKHGSIAAAVRAMKLGYGNAWLWVEAINRLSDTPLVGKIVGGAGGGHARLMEEGHRVVLEYKKLRAQFNGYLEQIP